MYVKMAVMRWVKVFIVGQPAGQKNGKRPRGPRYTSYAIHTEDVHRPFYGLENRTFLNQ